LRECKVRSDQHKRAGQQGHRYQTELHITPQFRLMSLHLDHQT
jgi:hypothetical protein